MILDYCFHCFIDIQVRTAIARDMVNPSAIITYLIAYFELERFVSKNATIK